MAMSADRSDVAGRLAELTAQFTVTAAQSVAELLALARRAAGPDVAPRRQLLQQLELLAHRLNGRAAIYEFAELSARAAAVEAAAAAQLADSLDGNESGGARLQALCHELVAALPRGSDH
jgi:HPt (histidine-containing phosphotransfer) domain-containing protein